MWPTTQTAHYTEGKIHTMLHTTITVLFAGVLLLAIGTIFYTMKGN